jgi:hypothetical protein
MTLIWGLGSENVQYKRLCIRTAKSDMKGNGPVRLQKSFLFAATDDDKSWATPKSFPINNRD